LPLFVTMILLAAFRLFSIRSWKIIEDQRLIFVTLLLANFAGIAYSVWKMDAPAPSDRTAAHLIPLFLGSGLFLFPHFRKNKWISYAQLVFLLIPVASITMANVSYNHFWIEDQVDESAFDLIEQRMKSIQKPVTISGSRYFDRTYAFRNTLRTNKLPDYDFDSWPNDLSDFLLLREHDYEPARLKAYHQIYRDPHSGSYLMERNVHLTRKPVQRFYTHFEADSLEYLSFMSFVMDSSSARNLIAAINCNFRFETSGECFIVTAALFDKYNNLITLKEQFHLNQLKSDWNNFETTRFSIPFFNIPEETREIRVYVYNDKKVMHGKFRALTTLYELIENAKMEN